METKTHWKKNLDSRYISGEDLKAGLKGLKPEMIVEIESFEDTETFDQNQNKQIVKTGLNLKEHQGGKVYKPVILNNTNAKFLIKEFASEYMEDWIGKPFVLYAQQDRRHGYVARFKKYYAPKQQPPIEKPQVSHEDIYLIVEQLDLITELTQLKQYWEGLSIDEKKVPQILTAKEKAKTRLSS
jgi:hypothetical protein